MIVEHQFLNKDFFIPDWDIKYLFIGTFNPQGGKNVCYFYARESNFLWKVLSDIFVEELNPYNTDNYDDFMQKIKSHEIACMDIIKKVDFDEKKFDKSRVEGKGYKDINLINNKINREYFTSEILSVIERNPNIKVYSTWGTGSKLKEWQKEVDKISTIVKLVSPSKAARVPKGEKKYEYILNNWKKEIV